MPVLREKRFLRVKVDMVGRCQLRCIMCHFAHPEFVENPWTMGPELLEKVAADLFPRAHDVVLSSSAEPLLAPDLPLALDLCRKYEVPNFHFSTNAINLNDRIINKCIDVQMPLLTISVDGGTKETFEEIRTPMKWELLMKRFDQFKRIKEERGSQFPKLSVTSVLMRRNIREMPGLVRLMHEKGVDYMNFVHLGVMGGLGVEDESLINDPKLGNETLEEVQRVADELGMQIVKPMPIPEDMAEQAAMAAAGASGEADEEGGNGEAEGSGAVTDATRSDAGGGVALAAPEEDVLPASSFTVAEFMNHKNREFLLKAREKDVHDRVCYFPWYYIHVNPDGSVFPCGSWFEFTTFGSFETQTFREIWTGKPYKELRDQILNMELRDTCANCTVSNMGRPDVLASFSHRAKIKRRGQVESGANVDREGEQPAGDRTAV